MRITKKMISAAEAAGACNNALEWARLAHWTVDELVQSHPHWAGWAEQHGIIRLTDDQVSHIVTADPWAAAYYLLVRLTQEQIAHIVAAKMWAAIYYLSDRLTDDQVAHIVAMRPIAAYYFSDRLEKK